MLEVLYSRLLRSGAAEWENQQHQCMGQSISYEGFVIFYISPLAIIPKEIVLFFIINVKKKAKQKTKPVQ